MNCKAFEKGCANKLIKKLVGEKLFFLQTFRQETVGPGGREPPCECMICMRKAMDAVLADVAAIIVWDHVLRQVNYTGAHLAPQGSKKRPLHIYIYIYIYIYKI